MKHHTRREFVQVSFLGFGSYLVLGAGCKKDAGTPVATTPAPPLAKPDSGTLVTLGKGLKTFTPEQFLTVCAACERILPKDEDPGANDLGVPYYIDGQLADPNLDDWKKAFLGGLSVLNRQSIKGYGGKAFHLASTEEQDQLLARWQAGKSGESRFFQVLMNLTFEGAFGDPSHGGNKGGQGFAMVGFTPGPPTPAMPGMHH